MDEITARQRLLSHLASGLATTESLMEATGLPEATVTAELAAARTAGLVSRIDLPGAPTWRSTGAGLLYGVFPDPAPQAEVPAPPLAEQPVARIEAAVKAAVDAAVEATHQVGGEPSTSAPASADAPVDDAWRGWATRWLRYAYDDGRLDSEEIAERLDEVQRATSLRGLDAALHGLVRVPVVEAAERAAETEG